MKKIILLLPFILSWCIWDNDYISWNDFDGKKSPQYIWGLYEDNNTQTLDDTQRLSYHTYNFWDFDNINYSYQKNERDIISIPLLKDKDTTWNKNSFISQLPQRDNISLHKGNNNFEYLWENTYLSEDWERYGKSFITFGYKKALNHSWDNYLYRDFGDFRK